MHEEKASNSAMQTPELDDVKAGRDLPDDVLDARIASVTQKFLDEPKELLNRCAVGHSAV